MAHQRPVLNDPSRFKVVVCGRRWGKTALGLLSTVFGHGKGRRRGAIDGGQIWWVAPDYPTADAIWRDLQRLCQPVLRKRDAVGRRIELPGGGSVTVKSAHAPESLVGVGLDGVVIDEAARIHPDAWFRSLRPTLSDTGGWAIFIGTPNGYNYLHKLFERAEQEPGWARWQLPTSQNPLIPQSELDAAKRDSPAFYGQEYLAQFTSVEGAEFPSEWFEGIGFDDWPVEILYKVLSLDPSKGKSARHGDYSAFIKLGMDRDKTLWVDADLARRPTTQIIEDGLRLFREWEPQAFAIETNAFQELLGGEYARVARESGMLALPIFGINNTLNKEVRIRQLGPLFAQRRVRIRNTRGGELLLQQLRDFRPLPHPAGYHDDGADSLHMAVVTLTYLLGGKKKGPGQPVIMTV